MPRPRKPAVLHRIHGTWRRDRHGEVPAQHVDLTGDQAELRRRMPESLGDRGRCAYLTACQAPWLGPIHAGLVAAYAVACDMCGEASRGLDAAMRDPAFATPGTEAHRAGMLYLRLATRLEKQALDLAHRLGLTPKGRLALGIRPDPPEPPQPPWLA